MTIDITSIVKIIQKGTESFPTGAIVVDDGDIVFKMIGDINYVAPGVTLSYSDIPPILSEELSPNGNKSLFFNNVVGYPYSEPPYPHLSVDVSSVFTENSALEEYTFELYFKPSEQRTGKILSTRSWTRGFELGSWDANLGMESFSIYQHTSMSCVAYSAQNWYHLVYQQKKVGIDYISTFAINGTVYLSSDPEFTPYGKLNPWGQFVDFGNPYHADFREPIRGYIADIGIYKTAKYSY